MLGDLTDCKAVVSFCEIPQLCREEMHTFHRQARQEQRFSQALVAQASEH